MSAVALTQTQLCTSKFAGSTLPGMMELPLLARSALEGKPGATTPHSVEAIAGRGTTSYNIYILYVYELLNRQSYKPARFSVRTRTLTGSEAARPPEKEQ